MKEEKNRINFLFLINLELNIMLIFFSFLVQINSVRNLENTDCLISNITVITTQWLNNIICIGDLNFRYATFATTSDGDMIIEITAIPDTSQRIFYGLTRDGKPYFSNNKDYFSTITISDTTTIGRYEGEIFFVNINSKEYLFSIGKGYDKYAELYDLKNNALISKILAIDLFDVRKIMNIRGSSSIYISNNKNYIFSPFINNDDSNNYLYLEKFYFSSITIDNRIRAKTPYIQINVCGNIISCFLSTSNYIFCLYYFNCNCPNDNYCTSNIIIGVYNTELIQIKETTIDYSYDTSTSFSIYAKCIHLEGDAGVFNYYKRNSNGYSYYLENFPVIRFKK